MELENYTLFMAKEFTPSASNRAAYDKMTDTPIAGVVPPQAVELEETVLGALMLEKDSIIAVQEYITADAFYTEEHRLIYKAIESLSAELKPIDLYTVTERLKARKELKKTLELMNEVAKKTGATEVAHDVNVAKISAIGVGMRNHSGVAARAFSALNREGINILMISTSEIKITILIEEKYLELAVRILHDTFGLDWDIN